MFEKFNNVKDERWLKRYLLFLSRFNYTDTEGNHRHHILPQKIYPQFSNFTNNPWNLSVLSTRAHYLAHYMLARALGGNMWYAWNRMNNSNGHNLNSKLYEVARIEHSKVVSADMIKNNPMYNPETVQKARESNMGRKASEETKKKMSKSQSIAQLGKVLSEETKEKLRVARLGQDCPRKGTKHSEESKKLMAESHKGKMTGKDHFKVVTLFFYNALGILKYTTTVSLTSDAKNTSIPLMNIYRKGIFKTRNKKYKEYEGWFMINPTKLKFKQKDTNGKKTY